MHELNDHMISFTCLIVLGDIQSFFSLWDQPVIKVYMVRHLAKESSSSSPQASCRSSLFTLR